MRVLQPRERDKPPITAVVETKDVPKVDEKGETTHVSIEDKINEDAVTKPKEETPTIEKIGDSLRVRRLLSVIKACITHLELKSSHILENALVEWGYELRELLFFYYYVKNRGYA